MLEDYASFVSPLCMQFYRNYSSSWCYYALLGRKFFLSALSSCAQPAFDKYVLYLSQLKSWWHTWWQIGVPNAGMEATTVSGTGKRNKRSPGRG